jgi:protein phosphatase
MDTQPYQDPDESRSLPEAVLPYLYLYPYRLHVPEVYGFCQDEAGEAILLLENAPLTETGELQPSIVQAFRTATPVRQVYWLWQMLELWTPCFQLNVASSLLSPDNIRVDGWRIRLKELIADKEPSGAAASFAQPTLANLAQCWTILLTDAKPAIADSLRSICTEMQAATNFVDGVAAQLNQLLLEQAGKLPLHLQVCGATDIGKQRSHNEDTCFPLSTQSAVQNDLAPRLTILCDGIGGHEGGEIASQLAIQTLQLQVRALLTEVAEQSEPVQPDVMAEELTAIVRVVNNLIASQNDSQAREARRRMGTTLVMALQLPQRIKLPGGAVAANGHELYLVNVGDSRAYWITPNYCHQLMVDDDVAVREVRMGRSRLRDAMKRPDAGALTQALGTRDGEQLYPFVRRFILEEDGMLLLCSDGLSDNGLVEFSWAEYADRVLNKRESLESAVRSWIALANDRNGHDNVSIVLTHCNVSSPLPEVRTPVIDLSLDEPEDDEIPAIAEPLPIPEIAPLPKRKNRWGLVTLLLLVVGGGAGIGVWYWRDPAGVMRARDQAVQTGVQVRDRVLDTANSLLRR